VSLTLYIQSPTNKPADIAAAHTPMVERLRHGRFLVEIAPGRLSLLVRDLAAAREPFVIGIGANPLIAGAALLAGQAGLGLRPVKCGQGLIFQVPGGAAEDLMARLPVDFFWPLPDQVRRELKELGFLRGADLRRAGEQELRAHFGTLGYLIAEYSRGVDRRRVQSTYPVQEVRWERTIEETRDFTVLEAFLNQGAADLARELRDRQAGLRRLRLRIETVSGAVDSERVLAGVAPEESRIKMLLALLLRGAVIKGPATGLTVTAEPHPLMFVQDDFFSYRKARAGEHLARAVDFVNRRHPGSLVTAGALALAGRRERMLQLHWPGS